MKKAIVLLLLCLTCAACAQEQLYPAMGDNGKFGYLNEALEWVIAPQFDGAEEFRGDYAVVEMYSAEDEDDYQGVIDRSGEFVLEPVYSISGGYDRYYYGGRDTGIWLVWDDAVTTGWFDIPSGYFSGLHWPGGLWGWIGESSLYPVVNADGYGGYVSRMTGELVHDYLYDHLDPSTFHEGYTVLRRLDPCDPAMCTYEGYYVADEHGNTVKLGKTADGYELMVPYASDGFYDGLAVVQGVDAQGKSVGFGYINTRGEVAIAPQYKEAFNFTDGVAVVRDETLILIDTEGNILYSPERKTLADERDVIIGQGKIVALRADDVVVMDLQCRELFSVSLNVLGEVESLGCMSVSGVLWYRTKDDKVGFIQLDTQRAMPCVAAYDPWFFDLNQEDVFFSEGLQPVRHLEDSKEYGYIDAHGDVVIDYQFDVAQNFAGPFAYAEKNDLCGYIDKAGNWVYNWRICSE